MSYSSVAYVGAAMTKTYECKSNVLHYLKSESVELKVFLSVCTKRFLMIKHKVREAKK